MEPFTTLVCLFHHERQAQAALIDLRKSGIPESSISLIGGDGDSVDALDKSELAQLGMPDRDYDRLKRGIGDGGAVISVSAAADQVHSVESIFGSHKAEMIDDVESELPEQAMPMAAASAALLTAAPVAASDAAAIPVIEENLSVGKRTVDQGGIRLYRRIVEIPVETDVVLREEHVHVDWVPTDRPVSSSDAAFQDRSIELTETAEVAVVAKDARVVEEIVVSKDVVERTETVRDTLRHTEVEVEKLVPDISGSATATRPSGV